MFPIIYVKRFWPLPSAQFHSHAHILNYLLQQHPTSVRKLCVGVCDAVTNYHKVNDLKQNKCIILQFFKSEGRHWSHWAKIRVCDPVFSYRGFQEKYAFLLFPVFKGHSHSLADGPFLHFISNFTLSLSRECYHLPDFLLYYHSQFLELILFTFGPIV